MIRSNPTFALVLMLTLLLAASCSPPPVTDERAERLTQYFRDADINDDGVIDRSEIDAEIDADFDSLDYNGDGAVTIDDVHNEEQGLPEGIELIEDVSHHLPYDLDGDGVITRAEYRSYIESELLAEMDADGDGVISFDEYRAYHGF